MLWAFKKLVRKLFRRSRPEAPPTPVLLSQIDESFRRRKAEKLRRIRPLLRTDMPCQQTELFYDYLTDELREAFHIVDTANVSRHGYDEISQSLIAQHRNGLVLDCGAGSRSVYHDNVVNLEICAYESTDVRGVGERLPFRDGVFDAAVSLNVLEHVKDPFACAREIARTMKPGAVLYCVVPFLQSLHGYPHHYYNMTHQGLRSLFERDLRIEKQDVIHSGLPIWTLTSLLQRWAGALPLAARIRFQNMRVGDLMDHPLTYLHRSFVTRLPVEMNFELASTTALIARKAA